MGRENIVGEAQNPGLIFKPVDNKGGKPTRSNLVVRGKVGITGGRNSLPDERMLIDGRIDF